MDEVVEFFGLQQAEDGLVDALLVVHIGAGVFDKLPCAFDDGFLVGLEALDHVGLEVGEAFALHRFGGEEEIAGVWVLLEEIRVVPQEGDNAFFGWGHIGYFFACGHR